jgi:hypothetical protein
MSRHKKLIYLTPPQIERFMKVATELHRACCDPLMSPQCEHSRALTELNAAIVTALKQSRATKHLGFESQRSTSIRAISRPRLNLQHRIAI